MAINLELKIKVDSFRKIKKLLRKTNAEFRGTLRQKDIYFSINSKGLLKLRRQNGNYELIYYNRNEGKGKRFSYYNVINLKGKQVEETLKKLGRVETIIEKTRELYYLKDTRIHLDKVKSLGKFVELETLVISTKSEAASRFAFVIEALELDYQNQIRKSYKNLIKE